MSTGRELLELPQDQIEKTAKEWVKYEYIAPIFFNSMKEVMISKGSNFMNWTEKKYLVCSLWRWDQ